MTFAKQLATGKVAEGLIAKWLQARGSAVMPAYEIEISRGKGPQLFCREGEFVAPDMLVFNHDGLLWIEAKHKSVFTWYRRGKRWTTGIDLRHYDDYLKVQARTKLPVWLLFYHRESIPADRDLRYDECPRECPTGLFGNSLEVLSQPANISHDCPAYDESREGIVGHGRSGMIYWAVSSLKRLASKERVEDAALERHRSASVPIAEQSNEDWLKAYTGT